MPLLLCTGRDGIKRTFEYDFSQDLDGGFTFRVLTIPHLSTGDFFELLSKKSIRTRSAL